MKTYSLKQLTKLYWFHFTSLIGIVGPHGLGFTPILSVFYATLIAFGVSFFRSGDGPKTQKIDQGPARRFDRRPGCGRHLRQCRELLSAW